MSSSGPASSDRDVGREPGTPSPSSNRSRSRSANARAPASIWAHRSRPARVPTTYPSPKNTARPSVLLPSIVASLLPGADGGDRRAGRGHRGEGPERHEARPHHVRAGALLLQPERLARPVEERLPPEHPRQVHDALASCSCSSECLRIAETTACLRIDEV